MLGTSGSSTTSHLEAGRAQAHVDAPVMAEAAEPGTPPVDRPCTGEHLDEATSAPAGQPVAA